LISKPDRVLASHNAESQRIHSDREELLVAKVCAAMEAAKLTERERQFFDEYVSGGSMESIAQKNDISRMRVSQVIGDAVKKIRKKLGITLTASETVAGVLLASTRLLGLLPQ
jgi:DNA-directed RNA polymerase specialized sigma subunit